MCKTSVPKDFGEQSTILRNHRYDLPKFGSEDENVKRRVEVFETKALSSTLSNVNERLRRNCMDCIVWLANEINRPLQYLDKEDRWYESFEADDKEDFVNGGGKVFLEQREIQLLRASDLLEDQQPAEMAMQHESSFMNTSSLLAEEVLKVAEKPFVLVNKEGNMQLKKIIVQVMSH